MPDTIVVDTSVFSTAVETTLELNMTTTTVASEVSIGEPVPLPGAVVVAVCSLGAGPDGAWGTSDDEYGEPVSAITGVDGSYQLDLVGEACWATVAPPELLTDPSGGEVVLTALDVSEQSASGGRVVVERAAVAATSAPTIGAPQQPQSDDGSLVVARRSRPHGWQCEGRRRARLHVRPTADSNALPTPSAAQLAPTPQERSTLSVFVLAIAALLALSILLGLARPRSARVKPLHVA